MIDSSNDVKRLWYWLYYDSGVRCGRCTPTLLQNHVNPMRLVSAYAASSWRNPKSASHGAGSDLASRDYKGSSMPMQVFGTSNCKNNYWKDMVAWFRNKNKRAWVCRTVPLQTTAFGYSVRMWAIDRLQYLDFAVHTSEAKQQKHFCWWQLNFAQSLSDPFMSNVDIDQQRLDRECKS